MLPISQEGHRFRSFVGRDDWPQGSGDPVVRPISSRHGCGDDSELLEHQKPVEHQVERDVLAIAEVEYLNVVQPDGAAGWRDVAHRAVKYAVVSARDGGIDGLGTRLPARA